MARVHNFVAGPAALPLPVLEQAQDELLDFGGAGMSVMEMSHRSKEYDAVHEAALANLRRLMNVPDDYTILFLPGGASQQFAVIPMNFRTPGRRADYINTGSWSAKAIKEAKVGGDVHIAWDGKRDNYMRKPDQDELNFSDDAAYVHICSNETIEGIRYPTFPQTPAPLIADMSSEILSRVIDVSKFGMIYAGAQKNLGPSGLALAIIRNDLLERPGDDVPIYFRYKTHAEANSLYNTPNTWAIYLVKLVTEWLDEQGGIAGIEKQNEEKAAKLYQALDASDFWRTPAHKPHRSTMNVVWRLPSEELEEKFVKEAGAHDLKGLKGHRSVGGIRASIYNACPPASVDALIDFMKDFEQRYG